MGGRSLLVGVIALVVGLAVGLVLGPRLFAGGVDSANSPPAGVASAADVRPTVAPPSPTGDAGFVGLQVQALDEAAAAALGRTGQGGVLVRDVAIGGPGAIAGVRRGDLIVAFGGKTIVTFDDLLAAVSATKRDQEIAIAVQREGEHVRLNLKTTARPAAWRVVRDTFHNFEDIGFIVASLTNDVRQRFSVPWGTTGLVVTLVDEKKKIATGLKPGEVIVQANLAEVWDPAQLVEVVGNARDSGRGAVLLLIAGTGGLRYALLDVRPQSPN